MKFIINKQQKLLYSVDQDNLMNCNLNINHLFDKWKKKITKFD